MKTCSLVSSYHKKDKIFELNDKNVNRDNCIYFYYLLRQKFLMLDIDTHTDDMYPDGKADIIIQFDIHSVPVRFNYAEVKYLVLLEPDVVCTLNYKVDYHSSYDKVFTWDDKIVDNIKYFKINFSHLFPRIEEFEENLERFSNRKLLVMISGNKTAKAKGELYSKRREVIKWYEKNESDSFDLYGMGWDKIITTNRYARFLLNKLLKLFKVKLYPSYCGMVDEKKSVLRKYKFAVCYENSNKELGYITEKIFDCFFAGCVPIYWGAVNVEDYIPRGCFINRKDFSSERQLFDFLNSMNEIEYNKILSSIKEFIFSKDSEQFSADFNVNTIVSHVKADLMVVNDE